MIEFWGFPRLQALYETGATLKLCVAAKSKSCETRNSKSALSHRSLGLLWKAVDDSAACGRNAGGTEAAQGLLPLAPACWGHRVIGHFLDLPISHPPRLTSTLWPWFWIDFWPTLPHLTSWHFKYYKQAQLVFVYSFSVYRLIQLSLFSRETLTPSPGRALSLYQFYRWNSWVCLTKRPRKQPCNPANTNLQYCPFLGK